MREEFEQLATGIDKYNNYTCSMYMYLPYAGIQFTFDTELQTKHERKMTALRDELDLRRKTEIHEVEEVYMYMM